MKPPDLSSCLAFASSASGHPLVCAGGPSHPRAKDARYYPGSNTGYSFELKNILRLVTTVVSRFSSIIPTIKGAVGQISEKGSSYSVYPILCNINTILRVIYDIIIIIINNQSGLVLYLSIRKVLYKVKFLVAFFFPSYAELHMHD